MQPVEQVFKAVSFSYRIGQQGRMSTSIEDLRDAPEGLLTRSVPDLQLYHLVLNTNKERAEFDAHSHIMLLFEFIFHEPLKHARFPDARVPNDNDLKQSIVM